MIRGLAGASRNAGERADLAVLPAIITRAPRGGEVPQAPGPIFTHPFVPARDVLVGRTTDHGRVVIATGAFMNALLTHPRTGTLGTRSGVPQARGRLADALPAWLADDGADTRRARAVKKDVDRATRALFSAGKHAAFTEEVVAFVRDELKLDWPWVVLYLVEQLLDPGLFTTEISAPLMMQGSGTVSWKHGELQRDVMARVLKAMGEKPDGRRVDKKAARIADYAVWFYRVKVLGEPLNKLAREYHAAEHEGETRKWVCATWHNDRRVIDRGINEARRLLSLHQKIFKKHPPA